MAYRPGEDPPLSGAAIEARMRDSHAEEGRILERIRDRYAASIEAQMRYIREAHVDAMMLTGPTWIREAPQILAGIDPAADTADTTVFAKAEMPKKPEVDPRIAAERLLRSVLPEELCIALSATGECEIQGKQFSYVLKKDSKTHCKKKDGTVHSCCIAPEDTSCPDTDRIVAEYLLILNDEQKYLEIANLTQIGWSYCWHTS